MFNNFFFLKIMSFMR